MSGDDWTGGAELGTATPGGGPTVAKDYRMKLAEPGLPTKLGPDDVIVLDYNRGPWGFSMIEHDGLREFTIYHERVPVIHVLGGKNTVVQLTKEALGE